MSPISDLNKSILLRRNKIIWHLIFTRHKTVKEVAKKFGLKKFSVYSIIRKMDKLSAQTSTKK